MEAVKSDPSEDEREALYHDIERMKNVLRAGGDFSDDEEPDESDVDSDDHDDFEEDCQAQWAASATSASQPAASVSGSTGSGTGNGPVKAAIPADDVDTDVFKRIVIAPLPDAVSMLPGTSGSTDGEESTLDRDGAVPSTCLHLNRLYQETLVDYIAKIELVLAGNRERQTHLKNLLVKQGQDKLNKPRKMVMSTYNMPYFKDINGMIPPPNEDTQVKKALLEEQPYIRPASMWRRKQVQKLQEAVKANCMQNKMRPLMNRKELAYEKLARTVSLEEQAELHASINELDEGVKQIGLMSIEEMCGSREDTADVDWLRIASTDFDGARSANECEMIWKNAFHPSINLRRWTKDEETKLLDTGKKYNFTNWQVIAEELGTGRTAFQCLQRYQTKLNPCLTTGKWSMEEDAFLMEVIDSCTVGHDNIPWNQVAYFMEGRSREQCIARWKTTQKCRRRFTKLEDELLMAAVKRYGAEKWVEIAKHVPHRTHAQCRERYVNTLAGNVRSGFWSLKEDKLLIQLVEAFGEGNWSKVATSIPGRTDNMCLQRYRRLKNWELDNLPLLKLSPDEVIAVQKPEVVEALLDIDTQILAVESHIERLEREWTAVNYTEALTKLTIPEDHSENDKRTLRANLSRLKREKLDIKESALTGVEEAQAQLRKGELRLPIMRQANVLSRHWKHIDRVNEMVKRRVLKILGRSMKPSQGFLSSLADILPGGDLETEEIKEAMKVVYLYPRKQQVDNIVHLCLNTVRRKFEKRGRPIQSSKVSDKLDAELRMLLRGRVAARTTRGRPRRYLTPDPGVTQATEPNRLRVVNPCDPLIQGVSSMMFTALNVDTSNALAVADKHVQDLADKKEYLRKHRTARVPKAADTTQDSDDGAVEMQEFQESMVDADDADPVVCTDDQKWRYPDAPVLLNKPSGRHKIQSEDPLSLADPVVAGCIELLYKQRGADTGGESQVQVLEKNVAMATGAASAQYIQAPLPPSCATITAFKSLLLTRRKMVERAGKFHIPTALDTLQKMRAHKKSQIAKQSKSPVKKEPGIVTVAVPASAFASVSSVGKTSNMAKQSNTLVKAEPGIVTVAVPASVSGVGDANNVASTSIVSHDDEAQPHHQAVKPEHVVIVLPDGSEANIPVVQDPLDDDDLTSDAIVNIEEAPPDISSFTMENGDSLEPAVDADTPHSVSESSTVDSPPGKKTKNPSASYKTIESQAKAVMKLRQTHDYQMLNSRLASLFMWPALLSTVNVSQESQPHQEITDPPARHVRHKRKSRIHFMRRRAIKRAKVAAQTEAIKEEGQPPQPPAEECAAPPKKRGRAKGWRKADQPPKSPPPPRHFHSRRLSTQHQKVEDEWEPN